MTSAGPEEKFSPNYATPPGYTLEEWLEENGMTQASLAQRIDMSAKAVNQILHGKAPLTQTTALRLETVTGIPARTWNLLEAHYQEQLARISARENLAGQIEWLKDMPLAQLRKFGFISASPSDRIGAAEQLLRFFGVADPDAWRKVWLSPQASFRRSKAFESKPEAVATWLRIGEIEAQKIATASFDLAKLRSLLNQLRKLTLEPPEAFVPELVQACASAGVAVVFVPEITGSRCSGAARWIGGKAVVQLSLRYGTDAQFWFSFFHEIGHIVLHNKRDIFVDDDPSADNNESNEEKEADEFAAELLIPRRHNSELADLRSPREISEFAQRIGIAPGVVVGRLQRDRVIHYSVGNKLKRSYKWAEQAQS